MRQVLSSRIMARTTIDLDASVLQELRRRAKVEHKSMGQLASERLALALREDAVQPAPLCWPAKRMGSPVVDLQDKDAVLAILNSDPGGSRAR
jgi:hypothetical protein